MPDVSNSPLRERSNPRLGAARQQSILTLISRGDILAVGDLASRFGVSQETIRRDIRSMEEAGKLRRVHGGAAPAGTVDLTARRPVTERLEIEREAKALAAEAALPLFEEGMNVFLGGSSTMRLLADELARRGPALSVTTNMIDIATALAATGRCTVTLLGGVLNPATHTLTGPEFLKSLEKRVFDLSICGASAIDLAHGFLGPSEGHAAIGETLAERARRIAFVVDASKFSRSDAHVVQKLARVDALATDRQPTADVLTALNEARITLLLPAASRLARESAGPDRIGTDK